MLTCTNTKECSSVCFSKVVFLFLFSPIQLTAVSGGQEVFWAFQKGIGKCGREFLNCCPARQRENLSNTCSTTVQGNAKSRTTQVKQRLEFSEVLKGERSSIMKKKSAEIKKIALLSSS